MTGQLAFRRGVVTDLGALIAINGWDAGYPEGERELREWLDAAAVTLAVSDGRAVGYAAMRPIFFHRPFVEALVVDPAYRRRGIAVALLANLDGLHDSPRLWTSTNRSNAPMRALLASNGFTYAGEVGGLDEGDPEFFYYRSRHP